MIIVHRNSITQISSSRNENLREYIPTKTYTQTDKQSNRTGELIADRLETRFDRERAETGKSNGPEKYRIPILTKNTDTDPALSPVSVHLFDVTADRSIS